MIFMRTGQIKAKNSFYQYVDSYLDINIADEKLKVYDYSSDYVPAAAAEVAKGNIRR